MTGKTHLLGGAFASELVIMASQNGDFHVPVMTAVGTIIAVGCCILGSVFPDIDISTSKIGSIVKPLSTMINKTVGHRTMLHSPLLYLVLVYLSYRFWPFGWPYVLSFVFGAFSHLALDFFNPAGIPIFWPVQTRFWMFGVKTNSKYEFLISGMLLVLVAVAGLRVFVLYGPVIRGVINLVP